MLENFYIAVVISMTEDIISMKKILLLLFIKAVVGFHQVPTLYILIIGYTKILNANAFVAHL